MQTSIGLALVLLLGDATSCLANTDFLRVSVECPNPGGSGILQTIDEKPNGNQSRVSTSYIDGQVDRITVSYSGDGSNFRDRFTLSRSTSAGTKEFPAFRAFEDRANELLRFFCQADPETRQRYLDLLQANRQLLIEEKSQ
ncbi:hypothetical protein [Mesorhizobium huakuii]|uniref:Uncharacterized protein n=1 Tax=Mesorhizobium huakuii TaxID=28104 RepID=A0A7G6SYG9_9HYPH|nr:hypothetical protein [Mesorhizobium huakuii]QND59551.1 hypothetical protein HB778_25490 [Mesorhizobium huakuii]